MDVIKRDGTVAPYDRTRVVNAVMAALDSVGMSSAAVAGNVADDVEREVSGYLFVSVEQMQDFVEKALMKRGLEAAAKSYILYRDKRARARGADFDIKSLVDGYVKDSDWRVRENANASRSFASLSKFLSGSVLARYGLMELYPEEIREMHRCGDIHLHDLSGPIIGYCAGYSLKDLLLEGLHGTPDKAASRPPKYLLPALQQAANFLCTLQSEWNGAQAFSSFDTYMAPFIRVNEETGEICDKPQLSYKRIKQYMQTFLFYLNAPCRSGEQTFSNITMDLVPPPDLANVPVIIGGKRIDGLYYKDCTAEMELINRAFLDLMMEGDGAHKSFSFPIPTYNITREFPWQSPIADKLFALAGKYGTPYFQNFVNSDIRPEDTRSLCCRLRLNMKELRKKTGALFGNGENTGSVAVATVNMPCIGYTCKGDEARFFQRLDHVMDMCSEACEIRRRECQKSLDAGLLPYTKIYVKSLDNHFNTIGLIGMNECCLNFMGRSIADPEGKAFAKKVLQHMLDRTAQYQNETGHLYNLEAVPGEGASYRLAKADRKRFPGIITAGTDAPYYTNSTWLPVGYTDDVFEMLDHQDELQAMYTGGTVAHLFLGEAIGGDACKRLVRTITDSYRLPAFTITPVYSICPTHGYIAGAHETCPVCVSDNKEA